MVKVTTTTGFGNAPQNFETAVTRDKSTGRIIDIRETLGSLPSGFRTTRRQVTIREKQELEKQQEQIRMQVLRAQELFEKAKTKALSIPEIKELQELAKTPIVTQELEKPFFELSAQQQLQKTGLTKADKEFQKLQRENARLEVQKQLIAAEQKRLETDLRVARVGASPFTVTQLQKRVKEFNEKVEKFNIEQGKLGAKSQSLARVVKSEKTSASNALKSGVLPTQPSGPPQPTNTISAAPGEPSLVPEPIRQRFEVVEKGIGFAGEQLAVTGFQVGKKIRENVPLVKPAVESFKSALARDSPLLTFLNQPNPEQRVKAAGRVTTQVGSLFLPGPAGAARIAIGTLASPTPSAIVEGALFGGLLLGTGGALKVLQKTAKTGLAIKGLGVTRKIVEKGVPIVLTAGIATELPSAVQSKQATTKLSTELSNFALGAGIIETGRFGLKKVPSAIKKGVQVIRKPEVRVLPPTKAEAFGQITVKRPKIQTVQNIKELFGSVQKTPSQAELAALLKRPGGVRTEPVKPSREAQSFSEIKTGKIVIQPRTRFKPEIVKEAPPKKTVVLGPAKPKDVKIKRLPGGLGEKGNILLALTLFGDIGSIPGSKRTGTIAIPKSSFLKPIRLEVSKPLTKQVKVFELKDLLPKADFRAREKELTRLLVGQLPRELPRSITRDLSLVQSALKTGTDLSQGFALTGRLKEISGVASGTRIGVRSATGSATASRTAEALKTLSPEIFRTNLKEIEIIETKPLEKTSSKTRSKSLRGTGLGFGEFFFEGETPRQKTSNLAYNVFVKERGAFKKVNEKPLPRNSALNLGAEFADNTPSRRFKAVSTGKNTRQPDDLFTNLFKFRPATKKKDALDFIEKTGFAIDTQGEIEGITVQGWKARRKQGLLGGLFGGTKNKKKKGLLNF